MRNLFRWALPAVCLVLAAAFPAAAAPVGDPGPGWLSEAERQIAAREYEITWQGEVAVEGLAPAWQAPIWAHGSRTYFTEEGT
jgi:hypothetical protein